MRNLKILLLIFFEILVSCKNKNDKEVYIQSFDIINSNKDLLKQKIFETYSNIPDYVFYENNSTNYNAYKEFISLDSLLRIFEKMEKTEVEYNNLQILRYKRYLLTGNYEEATGIISNLSRLKEEDDLIQLYKAIVYELNNNNVDASKIYKQLSNLYIKENNCDKLSIISALTNKIDYLIENKCDTKNYYSLSLRSNKEIIYDFFLRNFEL
jgi:hypothetical protein